VQELRRCIRERRTTALLNAFWSCDILTSAIYKLSLFVYYGSRTLSRTFLSGTASRSQRHYFPTTSTNYREKRRDQYAENIFFLHSASLLSYPGESNNHNTSRMYRYTDYPIKREASSGIVILTSSLYIYDARRIEREGEGEERGNFARNSRAMHRTHAGAFFRRING